MILTLLVRPALAAVPTLKVVAWIAAAAAVDALYNAVSVGRVQVDPVWLPAINVALFYARQLVKGERPKDLEGAAGGSS